PNHGPGDFRRDRRSAEAVYRDRRDTEEWTGRDESRAVDYIGPAVEGAWRYRAGAAARRMLPDVLLRFAQYSDRRDRPRGATAAPWDSLVCHCIVRTSIIAAACDCLFENLLWRHIAVFELHEESRSL